jgi:hypothetical protein
MGLNPRREPPFAEPAGVQFNLAEEPKKVDAVIGDQGEFILTTRSADYVYLNKIC